MQLHVIFNPLDEALRTKFICSVDNEAVLKTQSPKLPKRKKRKPPASGVEILDISAKLVPTLKLFAASARKQVICNLYACLD